MSAASSVTPARSGCRDGDSTDQLAAPQDRAEAAYDLSALLNTLDARIGSQLAGAESVGVDSFLEVSRVVRLAARTARQLGDDLLGVGGQRT